MDEMISRQAVLKLLSAMPPEEAMTKAMLIQSVQQMAAAQPDGPDNLVKDSQGLAKELVNDCISRQAAIHAICRDGVRLERGGALMITISTAKQWAVDLLGELPSAQPEIIRCRECKHYYFTDNRIPQEQRYVCDIGGEVWQPDDYCSYAERREVSE